MDSAEADLRDLVLMPFYNYVCGSCDHRFEEFLPMKNRGKPCRNSCPSCGERSIKQYVPSAPVAIDPVRLGVRRPDAGFREVISKIRGAHPRAKMKEY